MEHQVNSVVRINASAEKVWAILDDYSAVEKFSFGLDKSRLIGEIESGLGAKRQCVFHDGTSVVEEIVEYKANHSFKVVLTEFTMPLKTMYATLKVEKVTNTRCDVSMNMSFVMKFGPLGALMGMLMLRPFMKRIQKKSLSGLAYHAFTGNSIGSELPPKDVLAPALVL